MVREKRNKVLPQGTKITIKVGDILKSTKFNVWHKVLEIDSENIYTDRWDPDNTETRDRSYMKSTVYRCLREGTLYKSTPEKLALFILTNGKVSKQ